jgi:hypothetical protein
LDPVYHHIMRHVLNQFIFPLATKETQVDLRMTEPVAQREPLLLQDVLSGMSMC